MSKAADMLQRRFGQNLSESLGVRTNAGPPADRFPGESAHPGASPDDGRTRAREAGHMEIERVAADPDQPRKEFSPESISRLAESLLKHGQLQPIRVRWNTGLGKWVVISGERRFRAAIQAGMKTVACVFTDGELTPSEILQEQLVENLLREDLKPVESARAYRQLMDLHGWTAKELSAELHVSQGAISKALSLLSLPTDLQEQVDEGGIPATAAYEVAKVEGESAQREIAHRIVAEGLTRDDAVKAVRQKTPKAKGRGAGKAKKVTSRTLRTAGGSKVTVENRKGLDDVSTAEALRDALRQIEERLGGSQTAA